MTTSLLRPVAAAVLATLLLTGAATVRADIPAAENLLPSDTLGFFTVPDCAAFRAAAKVSPQMLFWNDPAMKPFRDKLISKLSEKYTASLEKDLGLKLSDFADLPQGQFTLGITVNGSNGHDDIPPGVVLLLDARDKSDALKTNLATLTKKWTDAGRTVRNQQIHGLKFTVITLSTNDIAGIFPKANSASQSGDEPKPQKPIDIYFTQYQSLLIAVNTPGLADSVASRVTGGSTPVIADDAVFAADNLSQFHNHPTYFGWFNGKLFINTVLQAPTDDDSDSPSGMPKISPAKAIAALGLSSLKSFSASMNESSEGSFLSVHVSNSGDTSSGLFKILALSPKDSSPPSFVPVDAIKFSRVRIDEKQAWTELLKSIAGFSPSALSSLNSVIDVANSSAQQKDPSFDLRTSLFGNLGDDLISYQKPPVSTSFADMSAPPSLSLVASPNPDKVVQSIKLLASLVAPQSSDAPVDFSGHKIYKVTQRPVRRPDGTPMPTATLFMSTASGYAAFSADLGILEDFLRSSDGKVKPLSDLPGLADAFQHAGGSSGGLLGYQNQKEAMRATFQVMSNPANSANLMKFVPPTFRDFFDFTLLPDYSTVAKYFYISVFSGSTTPTGSTINVFSPRPPQLN